MTIDANPACPICGGTGYVTRDVPPGHPDFGKAYPCTCQQETIARRKAERLRRLSNLAAYSRQTFETFRPERDELTSQQNAILRSSFDLAWQYAQQPDGWLFIQGGYGCGKTHLAAAIGNAQLLMEKPVIFLTVPDLLDHLRSTYVPSAENRYDELFDQVRETPLLILDDLGTENATPWATEKLFQLLNHRYARQLPTVITTNHSLDEIDDRIRSRLVDQYLTRSISMDLPDYRLLNETQQTNALTNLHLYSRMTFENFDFREDSLSREEAGNLHMVYDAAYEFAHAPKGWLVLLGGHGAGKTHLAAAIANERHFHGEPVTLVTTADLLDHLRDSFSPTAKTGLDKRFNEIRNATLLILDHFTLHTATPWAREKLFQVIDYRYLAMLPTVITKFGDGIQDLDEAFQSRFADRRLCRVLLIKAPDYRGGYYNRQR